jgi:hypothetical protein
MARTEMGYHPLNREDLVYVPMEEGASIEEHIYAIQQYVRNFRESAQIISGSVTLDEKLRPSIYYLTFWTPYEDEKHPHGEIGVAVDLRRDMLDHLYMRYDYEEDNSAKMPFPAPEDFSSLLEKALSLAKSVRTQDRERGLFMDWYESSIDSDKIRIYGWSEIRRNGMYEKTSGDSHIFPVENGIVADPESGGMTWEEFYDWNAESR